MTIHQFSNILVVDDSSTAGSVVRKLLAQLGYRNVDEAADGAAALAKISENYFDLVISDWNMEPMGGDALLEWIRSSEKYKNLPFIMMTADSSRGKIVQARHAGVSCFINKPFRADALQAKMAPSDIKATFFNGQPFTATAPTGAKFTMTFTPDGKMKREALAQSGKTSVGTWKLNTKGFCTSWNTQRPTASPSF